MRLPDRDAATGAADRACGELSHHTIAPDLESRTFGNARDRAVHPTAAQGLARHAAAGAAAGANHLDPDERERPASAPNPLGVGLLFSAGVVLGTVLITAGAVLTFVGLRRVADKTD